MGRQDADFWNKAADARSEVADHYANDPTVKCVDIGYPPQSRDYGGDISVRIHVAEDQFDAQQAEGSAGHQTVNGIPVCVVRDR